MNAKTRQEAMEMAMELFGKDQFAKDADTSKRAGYDIYYPVEINTEWGHVDDHISDLGCRLEVNIGKESTNIWIDETHINCLDKAAVDEELLEAVATFADGYVGRIKSGIFKHILDIYNDSMLADMILEYFHRKQRAKRDYMDEAMFHMKDIINGDHYSPSSFEESVLIHSRAYAEVISDIMKTRGWFDEYKNSDL